MDQGERLTAAERRSAIRDFRDVPYAKRREGVASARRGRRHPDEEVAAVVERWATAWRQSPLRIVNPLMLIAAIVLSLLVHRGRPWGVMDSLLLALVVILLAAELWTWPATAAIISRPTQPPQRLGTSSSFVGTVRDDVGTERIRILSDLDKAALHEVPPPSTAAGWYADPLVEGGQRFWNGAQWTGRTMAPPPRS